MRSIPMSQSPTGWFRVAAIRADGDLSQRLADLGLRVGAAVDVIGNHGANGILVGCGDARLALDMASAARVHVVPVRKEN